MEPYSRDELIKTLLQLNELVYGEDEAKASALSPRRYEEMVHIYTHYKEKYRHERDV